MRQIALITVYKDKEQLFRLVKKMSKNFDIYIHIDIKSNEFNECDISELREKYHCSVIKKYKIYWGSYCHLQAILELLKNCLEKGGDDTDMIHIISGQDYPATINDNLFHKLDFNKIYMTIRAIDDSKELKNRYRFYWDTIHFNKNAKIGKIYFWLNPKIQKILNVKRVKIGSFDEKKIYKGFVYISASRSIMEYVYCYQKKNSKFMKDLKRCYIAEEFFFQTILANSKYKKNIVNDSLRYMDWNFVNGSLPAILDERHFEKINIEKFLFIRKVESKISNKLLDKIDQRSNL